MGQEHWLYGVIKDMVMNTVINTTLREERGKVKDNLLGKIFLVSQEEDVVNKEYKRPIKGFLLLF